MIDEDDENDDSASIASAKVDKTVKNWVENTKVARIKASCILSCYLMSFVDYLIEVLRDLARLKIRPVNDTQACIVTSSY